MSHLFFRRAIPVIAALIFFFGTAFSVDAATDQNHFWFRDDDGNESTATGFGASNITKNTNATSVATGTLFRLRFSVKASGSASTISPQAEFQQGSTCTGGTWTAITSGSSTFALQASSNFTDGDPTTQQISTGQFTAGKILESTNPAASITISQNRSTEYEWSLKLSEGAPAETTYSFRITGNGTPLGGYTNCPSLSTKSLTPPPTNVQWNQTNFKFRDDDGGEVSATGWGDPDAPKDGHLTINTPGIFSEVLRLRIAIRAQQDGGTITPRLEVRVTEDIPTDCSGLSGWRPVAGSGFRYILRDSHNFADQTSTTQNISSGSGFVSGLMLDTSNPAPPLTLAQNEKTEYEWSLKDTEGFTRGAVYSFRITDDGTPLHTYSVCPRVVFPKPDYGIQVPQTTLTFSGQAWPEAKITVIERSREATRLMKQETVTADDGTFDIAFEGVLQNQYTYGVLIADEEGRTTQAKTYPIDTVSNSLIVKEILAPPTAGFTRSAVTRGDFVKIIGFASPQNKVRIEVDGGVSYEAAADEEGRYGLLVNTARLYFGRHHIKVRQVDAATKRESDFSPTQTFVVTSVRVAEADFNSDNQVDIKDWSIFLSRWKESKEETRRTVDLNRDGTTDIADFSVFLRAFKK